MRASAGGACTLHRAARTSAHSSRVVMRGGYVDSERNLPPTPSSVPPASAAEQRLIAPDRVIKHVERTRDFSPDASAGSYELFGHAKREERRARHPRRMSAFLCGGENGLRVIAEKERQKECKVVRGLPRREHVERP